MMYSFNYKQGTPSFDRVKSLVEAIGFELPRNWDCSKEMARKADETDAFMRNKAAFSHLSVFGLYETYTPHTYLPQCLTQHGIVPCPRSTGQ